MGVLFYLLKKIKGQKIKMGVLFYFFNCIHIPVLY